MRAAVILAIGAGLALLTGRQAQAATAEATGPAWAGGLDAPAGALPSFGGVDLTGWQDTVPTAATVQAEPGTFDVWGFLGLQAEAEPVAKAIDATDTAGDNLRAFLAAIAWAEGTERAADPYRVCYGYRHTIRDLSDHPAESGEWSGEPLDKLGPAYRGKVSTAAGRYQIIRPTWRRARAALGLRDFGAESQDAAAVWLIRQRGALDLVQSGQIEAAAQRCAAEWASLPGSTSGQPQRRMAALVDTYTNAGGTLA